MNDSDCNDGPAFSGFEDDETMLAADAVGFRGDRFPGHRSTGGACDGPGSAGATQGLPTPRRSSVASGWSCVWTWTRATRSTPR